VLSAFSIISRLAWDLIHSCELLLRPRESLEAEILSCGGGWRERGVEPKRIDAATRVTLGQERIAHELLLRHGLRGPI
jgi:hypothetical protein